MTLMPGAHLAFAKTVSSPLVHALGLIYCLWFETSLLSNRACELATVFDSVDKSVDSVG